MPAHETVDPVPHAHFPKQAIVVIHGMGEQSPMDTIKGFVRAVWETDPAVSHNGMPDPAEVWSKPDLRTGSLELRRITTRQSRRSDNFPNGVRTDFYELYWADLSGGSTLGDVENWVFGMLFRNPFTRVPPPLRSLWLLLLLLSLGIGYLALAGVFKPEDVIFGVRPYGWMAPFSTWLGPLLAAALGYFANSLLVPYFGRVVRYTRATPQNIAARKDIRERGLALLSALHDGSYERIILVGHSLGSILGYDLLSYFWASRPAAYSVSRDSPEFALFRAADNALQAYEAHRTAAHLYAFHEAQRHLANALRRRPAPKPGEPDTRWLITDFITLGSPLTHAGILLASDEISFQDHVQQRQYPVAPPVREILDPKNIHAAETAGFVLDKHRPRLMAFPLNEKSWELHHAAPFAAVRWTNIHDPARFIFLGDVISGPLAPHFGAAITDINLRALRGPAHGFTHTKYWDIGAGKTIPPAVTALREALNLAGDKPAI
jgi:hypothetical protein